MRPVRRLTGGDRNVTVGFVVLVLTVLVTLAVFSGIPRRKYDTRGTTVKAVFANTAVMSKKTSVRVHGVVVGKVKTVSLNEGGRSATVEMAVRSEGMPLYNDASAHLKFATLLGGNYTIDIDPGTPSTGRLTPLVIPESRTTDQVEVDQILEPVRSAQRRGLKTMLHELPLAFQDQAAPARALGRLADVAPTLGNGLSALRGEVRDQDLRGLVANTARTVRALDAPAPLLTRLVRGAAVTTQTTARREADLRATIGEAATAMPLVRSTTRELNHTLTLADPVVGGLRSTAGEVAPTVRDLRPTLVGGYRLLDDARPLLHSLRPAVNSLATAARLGRPVLDQVAPSLQRTAGHILPDLARRDAVTRRTSYEMIGPTVEALQALGGSFDNVAGLVQLSLGGGERALDTTPCRSYFTDPTTSRGQILKCEDIATYLGKLLGSPAGSGP